MSDYRFGEENQIPKSPRNESRDMEKEKSHGKKTDEFLQKDSISF